MSKFLFASIGRKFLMSITGIFLLLFILVHLTINLLLIFDDSGALYNQGAHFMVSNPVIRIIEPVLALGFLIHIIWSLFISWENWRARPVKYKKENLTAASSWLSRNMLILGALVFVFLVIHFYNFYIKIKFTGSPLLEDVAVAGKSMHNYICAGQHPFQGKPGLLPAVHSWWLFAWTAYHAWFLVCISDNRI